MLDDFSQLLEKLRGILPSSKAHLLKGKELSLKRADITEKWLFGKENSEGIVVAIAKIKDSSASMSKYWLLWQEEDARGASPGDAYESAAGMALRFRSYVQDSPVARIRLTECASIIDVRWAYISEEALFALWDWDETGEAKVLTGHISATPELTGGSVPIAAVDHPEVLEIVYEAGLPNAVNFSWASVFDADLDIPGPHKDPRAVSLDTSPDDLEVYFLAARQRDGFGEPYGAVYILKAVDHTNIPVFKTPAALRHRRHRELQEMLDEHASAEGEGDIRDLVIYVCAVLGWETRICHATAGEIKKAIGIVLREKEMEFMKSLFAKSGVITPEEFQEKIWAEGVPVGEPSTDKIIQAIFAAKYGWEVKQ